MGKEHEQEASPRRARRDRGPLATFACLALVPGLALAQEPIEPIRLTYRASGDCPDAAQFGAGVRARTARVRFAGPQEAARVFDVTVDAGPPATGRVAISQGDQAVGTRSVRGDTCSEVADAIALVVALAVDPRASPTPGSPLPASLPMLPEALPPVPRPDPPVTPISATPRLVARPVPPPGDPAHPQDRPTSGAGTAPNHPHTAGLGASHAAFAGADFVVATGVFPSALLAGAPFAGWRANGSRWLDPSLRVAFLRAGTDPFAIPTGGTATFVITVGRLDACPVAWRHVSVRATACARLEAGALDAAGGSIAAARSSLRPWLAAGLLAHAEWSLAPPFFLDLEGGALFRIVNDRFVFQPDVRIYDVPIVGFGAGAGLGVDLL